MAIALTLAEYLHDNQINYEVIPHSYTRSSLGSAMVANIPPERLAKAVLLKDEYGYVVAVVPADRHVKLGQLSRNLHRRLGLATENEITKVFKDCERGAIPPTGEAYRLNVVIDKHLDNCEDIYFEAGDHTDLVHLKGEEFRKLMRRATHASFSSAH